MRRPRAALFASAAFFCAAMDPSAAAEPWRDSDLVKSSELAARFSAAGSPKPKILYIGYGVLYRSKHIPGALFIGPAAKQEGLEALRSELMKLPHTEEVVVYCGCCPADKCPNIRPAFVMLRELGFKRARLLWLPTSFLKDWIEKGYPIESGSAHAAAQGKTAQVVSPRMP